MLDFGFHSGRCRKDILNSGNDWKLNRQYRGTGVQVERIFQGMESPARPDSSSASSFAGFLAALAQPDRAAADRASSQPSTDAHTWNDELLAEDVATLSYEQALRVHARYHADDSVADPMEASPAAPVEAAANQPDVARSAPINPAKVLKESSITIRLSREEDAQLRRRAAEAGLTISAYIRSCTFEAESLRALVKDTLTQFRTAGPRTQQDTNAPNRRRRWSAFFWPGRRAAHSTGPNQA